MTLDPLERKRALNHREACIKARELWGEFGHVEMRHSNPLRQRYVVGTKGARWGRRAYGSGNSWEAAFAVAERRGLQ